MDIRECTTKESWENQYTPLNQAEFLQSWEWGVFQEAVGNRVLRLQAYEGADVVWQGQGIVYRYGLGSTFVYFPRVHGAVPETVCGWLKEKGFVFGRFESASTWSMQQGTWSTHVVNNRQPKDTLVLDLSKSEEDLLAEMHSKTRYNIRLSERKGVEVRREPNIEVFWMLHHQTTERDVFSGHSKSYYEQMLSLDICEQFTAYYDGQAIASTICMMGPDSYVYLHGASSNEHRNVMAPYLLQWIQIQHAKALGLSYYDFWGVSPQTEGKSHTTFHTLSWDTDNSWTGVSRFKAGFGGERRSYARAREIVFRPLSYRLFQFAKALRR